MGLIRHIYQLKDLATRQVIATFVRFCFLLLWILLHPQLMNRCFLRFQYRRSTVSGCRDLTPPPPSTVYWRVLPKPHLFSLLFPPPRVTMVRKYGRCP